VHTCSAAERLFRTSTAPFGPGQFGEPKLFNRNQEPYRLTLDGKFKFFDGKRGTNVFVRNILLPKIGNFGFF